MKASASLFEIHDLISIKRHEERLGNVARTGQDKTYHMNVTPRIVEVLFLAFVRQGVEFPLHWARHWT